MIVDVIDRVPENAGRVILIPVTGQANTYDMVRADNPSEVGTPINRTLLMAMQGFVASTTTFNSDGSVTETGATGTKVTTFSSDGQTIVETFTGKSGGVIRKTTTIASNGNITETIA